MLFIARESCSHPGCLSGTTDVQVFKVLVFAHDNLKIDCAGGILSPSQYKEGRATLTTVAHALWPDRDPDQPGRSGSGCQ